MFTNKWIGHYAIFTDAYFFADMRVTRTLRIKMHEIILYYRFKITNQFLNFNQYTQPPEYKMFESQKIETQSSINTIFQSKVKNPYIQSANSHLNSFFSGGLHFGTITQIYGEAGSGKTQLAMLFALGAMERCSTVGFLAAGKDLHFGRFTKLAYHFMNQNEYQQRENYLLYKKANDFQIASLFISEALAQIQSSGKGGLLIIDSVYALMNSCFEQHNIDRDNLEKSKKQADFINKLRWMSKNSKTAVLLINQASDNVQGRRSFTMGSSLNPALGPSWDMNMDESFEVLKRGQNRQIKVINSPKCRAGDKFRFRIKNESVVGISEDGVQYD